jgi:DHA1 family tetracycline resistance protein-like MFS transporter
MSDKLKAAAPFILVTVFLDMISIGIIIPVLPKLILSFVHGSVSVAGIWTGVFGAVWGLAQFLFSPVQGGASDALGRRPVVLASNLGLSLDYLLMALAPNLMWLLVGRIISGMTAASISTAYAYMSDVTPPEKRASVFGLMGAAFGVGFIIGPGLGGVLGGIDPRLPFYAASALSLINFAYGLFVLPESLPKDKRKPFSFHAANPVGAIKFLARSAQVLRLSGMYLLMMFAQSVFPTTMVLYADYRFGWGPTQVGFMLLAVGVLSAIVQGGLTGRIVKLMGERRAMLLGLICGAVAFIGYALAPSWPIFVAFLPIGSLWGVTTPNIQSLMSSKIDPQEQGRLQGANMSLGAMATIFAPLIFGGLLAAATCAGVPVWLSGAAFGLAGLFLLIGLWLGLGVTPALKVEPGYEGDPIS